MFAKARQLHVAVTTGNITNHLFHKSLTTIESIAHEREEVSRVGRKPLAPEMGGVLRSEAAGS